MKHKTNIRHKACENMEISTNDSNNNCGNHSDQSNSVDTFDLTVELKNALKNAKATDQRTSVSSSDNCPSSCCHTALVCVGCGRFIIGTEKVHKVDAE